MTYQYEQVQSFAEDTQKEVENHKGGKIAAMGGHSQAAPAVAKVGADMKVGKIINFQPWASEAAVNDKSSRGINADEKKYLDKHCHTYTDSGKNTVKYDGSGGKCAYGKIYVAEGSSHDVGFFHIKGNGLNVDYYYKNNKFCSGMTEEQVKTIAGIKAGSQSSANPNAFIQEYKDKFGSYAKSKKANKTSTQAANLLNSQRAKISAMPAKLYKHGKGKSGRGGKRILLRPGGISGITSKAVASAHQAESKLEQVTEEAKQDIWQIINDTRDEAFAIAPHLPAGEIESLLADLDFHNCWNEGTESRNQSQIHQYVSKVEALADNIEEASDSIQAADKEEASDITLL